MNHPVVLITGASRGIGAATALACAGAGWDVALNYRREQVAAEAVAAQVRSHGRRAWLLPGDVATEAGVAAIFAGLDIALQQGGGEFKGLVNNAGVVDVAQRVAEQTWPRWQRMFNTNVLGSLACAKEAVLRMGTRHGARHAGIHGGRGGSIVNVSSAASRLGSPGQYVDYAAAKGAIDAFTLGLAREVAAEGVRVNAVRPGIIQTDIHASGGEPDRAQRLAPSVPAQRAGTAAEVAAAIVWLLSDAASYTTGALLDVSGGR